MNQAVFKKSDGKPIAFFVHNRQVIRTVLSVFSAKTGDINKC
jgi:hypothetical protein